MRCERRPGAQCSSKVIACVMRWMVNTVLAINTSASAGTQHIHIFKVNLKIKKVRWADVIYQREEKDIALSADKMRLQSCTMKMVLISRRVSAANCCHLDNDKNNSALAHCSPHAHGCVSAVCRRRFELEVYPVLGWGPSINFSYNPRRKARGSLRVLHAVAEPVGMGTQAACTRLLATAWLSDWRPIGGQLQRAGVCGVSNNKN